MLAKKAATVVTTAKESGIESRAQARSHASAGSSISLRMAENARCKWIA